MTLYEPFTVATDCLLALASAIFCVLLWRRNKKTWALAFLFAFSGTLFGGVFHALGSRTYVALMMWKATAYSIGLASFFMLMAAVPRRWAMLFALVLFMAYATWTIKHDDFLWVVVDYGVTLLIIAGVHGAAWFRDRTPASLWIIGAIVISFAGAAVQQSSLAAGPLNHNDLFHLVQLAGLWMFYRGADQMGTATGRSTVQRG